MLLYGGKWVTSLLSKDSVQCSRKTKRKATPTVCATLQTLTIVLKARGWAVWIRRVKRNGDTRPSTSNASAAIIRPHITQLSPAPSLKRPSSSSSLEHSSALLHCWNNRPHHHQITWNTAQPSSITETTIIIISPCISALLHHWNGHRCHQHHPHHTHNLSPAPSLKWSSSA